MPVRCARRYRLDPLASGNAAHRALRSAQVTVPLFCRVSVGKVAGSEDGDEDVALTRSAAFMVLPLPAPTAVPAISPATTRNYTRTPLGLLIFDQIRVQSTA